jgi:hypothetical protein
MINKEQALNSLCPKAEWVWYGEDYDGLQWMDQVQTKPSKEEIDAEINRLKALEPSRIATANRMAAYISESDPLFFKAQRGEATMQEWQDKIAEIKARFPK